MNNKGQSLVLFVLILPILLLLGIFLVDTSKILLENTKLKNTTKLVIEKIMVDDIDIDKSRLMFMENNIDVENVEIIIKSDEVIIKNNYKIDSMLGKIIGINDYELDINLIGYKKDNNIKYKKG